MKIDIKKIALILAAGIFAISGAFGAEGDEAKATEWNIRVVNNLKMFTLDVDVFPKGPRPQRPPVSIKGVAPQSSSENVPFKGDIGKVKATAKKEIKITGPQAEVASASLEGNEETIEIDLSSITGITDEEIGIEGWRRRGKGRGKGKGQGKGQGRGQGRFRNNPIIYTLETEGNTIILNFKRAKQADLAE